MSAIYTDRVTVSSEILEETLDIICRMRAEMRALREAVVWLDTHRAPSPLEAGPAMSDAAWEAFMRAIGEDEE